MGFNTLEAILPVDQMNKPLLNYPTCQSYSDSKLDFVVSSLLSVKRLMNETHVILMSLSTGNRPTDGRISN